MKLFVLISLVLFSTTSFAQEVKKKEHPIDIKYNKCMDISENQTTMGMIKCAQEAKAAWEKEMDKYYKLLLTKLSGNLKDKLKLSQQNWISYKEKELAFNAQFYVKKQGTMWKFVAADNETCFIKHRALELKDYYDCLVEDGI